MSVDYKQLVQDRKTKQTRPLVRHPICLVPELYAEHDEATEELTALLAESVRNGEEDPDQRLGSLSPLGSKIVAARQVVADVEARIAEVTITGVFKAPSATRQGQLSDEKDRLVEASPDKQNEVFVDYAKRGLLEAYEHFEGPGGARIDTLSRDDLADMLDQWAQGEVLAIHVKIVRASSGTPDVPFSVRQSLATQRSAATSN